MADDVTTYRTPPTFRTCAPDPGPWPPWLTRRRSVAALVLVLGLLALALLGQGRPGLTRDGHLTLLVFGVAVWAWVCTRLDDTFVALAAGAALVLLGVVETEALFATLGDDTIWLLVSAFVIAAGVTSSGLATRAAAWLVTGARSVRGLVHLVTAALVVTAFAVPSTSGRAALTLPVFITLSAALSHPRYEGRHRRAILVLALTFPTVILLSAVGSLLGAGAHLVTSRVVATATGDGFSFAQWLILGLPLAVVSSHLAAELILHVFARREDRLAPVHLSLADFADASGTTVTGPLTVRQARAAAILAVIVVLWCTEQLHGVHPAIVALLGALVTTSPRLGSTTLKKTLGSVPWSLLLFMAATLALGDALITSRAAVWVAESTLGSLGVGSAQLFVLLVILLSTAAHLVIASRSARSAVLVPLVVAMAPQMGVEPAAAAFASTAAAGFCHTLPSSAKPVAIFSDVKGVDTFTPADLHRLSLLLAPLMVALVMAFSWVIWPFLGLPLLLPP